MQNSQPVILLDLNGSGHPYVTGDVAEARIVERSRGQQSVAVCHVVGRDAWLIVLRRPLLDNGSLLFDVVRVPGLAERSWVILTIEDATEDVAELWFAMCLYCQACVASWTSRATYASSRSLGNRLVPIPQVQGHVRVGPRAGEGEGSFAFPRCIGQCDPVQVDAVTEHEAEELLLVVVQSAAPRADAGQRVDSHTDEMTLGSKHPERSGDDTGSGLEATAGHEGAELDAGIDDAHDGRAEGPR